MLVNLFPFEHVRQGSRVVIYGFGDAGRQYYQQIQRTGYCKLIYFVDQGWRQTQNSLVRVVSPETLFEEPETNYDYVVISIDDEKISAAVITSLVQNGVPRNKIIASDSSRFISEEETMRPYTKHIKKDAMQPEEWKIYFEAAYLFRRNWAKSAEQFCPELVNYIECWPNAKEKLLSVLKPVLREMASTPARLIALELLYLQDCFDAECMKIFMQTLRDMEWDDDTPYGLVMDSTFMMLLHEDYLYPTFYIERRKLLKKICEYYHLHEGKKGELSGKPKVAVVTYCYFYENASWSHISMVKQYVNGIVQRGYDVNLFVINSLSKLNGNHMLLPPIFSFPEGDDRDGICDLTDWHVRIRWFYQDGIGERMQRVIDEIFDYNPKYILDMTDEVFPQAYIMQQYFPVIYMPMRTNMSSSFFDTFITMNKRLCIKENEIFNSFPKEKMMEVVCGNLPPIENNVTYNRADFGFDDCDFLLITVGVRLDNEISEELIENICSLFDREPNMKWILVGINNTIKNATEEFNQLVNGRRVRLWGFEEHLDSLYKICDVYVQPNRLGGGLSIRQAMRIGLPIAITDFSYAMSRMSEDGVIHGDYPQLMEYILKLYHDRDFYEERSRYVREIMAQFSPENDARKVLSVCEETCRRVRHMKKEC